MSRRHVSRCPACGQVRGSHRDPCTNTECSSHRLVRRGLHPTPVRIDTPGGTNRELPHTQMALAFARALTKAREAPPMADPSPFTDRMNAADERARRLLKEHGSVDSLRQATGDSWLTLRARAVQAEDELQALHTRLSNETGNPVTVYEQERQALLDEIGRLTDIAQRHEENAKGRVGEYQRLLADYQALQAKVADYQDMPDPQETRRRMDVLSQELHHVQETLATSQKKVTELLDEKHRAEDLIQNLKSNLSKGGRFTDEQVLELLMPLARRVHGLESKLFEQAGIFP